MGSFRGVQDKNPGRTCLRISEMRTSAAVLRDYSLSMPIEDVQLPSPYHDDILVRIVAAGVCHTDIKVAQSTHLSPRPIILGHEGAGIVEAVGDKVANIAPGDHVLLSFDYCACCNPCRSNRPSYCDEATPFTRLILASPRSQLTRLQAAEIAFGSKRACRSNSWHPLAAASRQALVQS